MLRCSAVYLTGTYGAMGGARANALPLPYYAISVRITGKYTLNLRIGAENEFDEVTHTWSILHDSQKVTHSDTLLFCQRQIHFHQLGNALRFAIEFPPEAIGFHNGAIILLMSRAKLGRHG